MFKRSWGTGIALGLVAGVAIACVLFFVSFPEFSDPSYQPETQQGEAAEAANQGGDKAQQVMGWWPWLISFVSPQDTLAQWIMAAFAVFATGVSILAVVLLDQTLTATRNAVKSADDAVEVTREMGQVQSRAYVSAKDGMVTGFSREGPVEVVVSIANTGNTPARRVRCQMGVGYVPDVQRTPAHLQRIQITSQLDVGSGEACHIKSVLDHAGFLEVYDRLMNQELFVLATGIIRYRDVFGHDRKTIFRMWLNTGDLRQGKALLKVTKKNNASN